MIKSRISYNSFMQFYDKASFEYWNGYDGNDYSEANVFQKAKGISTLTMLVELWNIVDEQKNKTIFDVLKMFEYTYNEYGAKDFTVETIDFIMSLLDKQLEEYNEEHEH